MSSEDGALPVLGVLPSSWRIASFGSVLLGGTRNGIYKPKQYHGSGAKIVNMGELFAHRRLHPVGMKRLRVTPSELERFGLQQGDLIFARRSLVAAGAGKCSLLCAVDEPTVFESSIIRARPDPVIADSAFLFYLFSSPYGEHALRTITRTVAVSGITGRDLAELRIPLPPLAEQHHISGILSALDDKIELNRRMNHTLESIARAIFKSWFVDFDPARKKMEGREVELPPDLTAAFPGNLVPSDVGPMPRGWRVIPIGDYATLDKGVSYKGAFLNDAGVPMVNLGCFLGRGRFAPQKLKGYSGECKERHTVKPGDIVVANTDVTQQRAVLGSAAVVPQVAGVGSLLFSHHVFAIRFRSDAEYLREFTYYSLLQPRFRERAEGFATGTTVLGLPREAILGCEVIVPPRQLVERFTEIARGLESRQNVSLGQSRSLSRARDALLPLLLSGSVGESLATRDLSQGRS